MTLKANLEVFTRRSHTTSTKSKRASKRETTQLLLTMIQLKEYMHLH